jgi:hypothetical protein
MNSANPDDWYSVVLNAYDGYKQAQTDWYNGNPGAFDTYIYLEYAEHYTYQAYLDLLDGIY